MQSLRASLHTFRLLLPVFFFNDTATTEIYTLSLHDALPILTAEPAARKAGRFLLQAALHDRQDRKSTRLNSSHANISYAVFCLKKKKNHNNRLLLKIKKKKTIDT